MAHVAKGQFTGAITSFKNTDLLIPAASIVNLLTEIAGNDEFANRAGTDDSTKQHLINLIADADKKRRLITYNTGGLDLRTVTPELIDPDQPQEASLTPLSSDHIQLSSAPAVELPYRLDGTDPNLPLMEDLRIRNGIGAVLYGNACRILVSLTRLESAHRNHMITVNDSLRLWSIMQSFRDLCDRLLGEANQVDLAQPLATDEPDVTLAPNRVNSSTIDIVGNTTP